jgi:2-succinyl-6-hydroxy-2,4-cyclohexadiene-1-carboxylate synthase
VTGASLHLHRRGHGPALVLLHGFTGSGRGMESLARAFEDDFDVLAPDLPGHGKSAIAPGYRFEDAVADLQGMLAAAGHRRACWLGYSMGARLALACAVQDPECASALVLVGGRAGIADPQAREARRRDDEALARRIETGGLEAFVDAWLEQPLFATQRRLGAGFLASARRERLRNDPAALAASLRALGPGAQPPLFDLLSRVRAPTLLVTGALDRKFTDEARELASLLPGARTGLIPDAGHAPHVERPEAFLEVVREFLRGSAIPPRPAHATQVQETAQ